MLPPTMFVLIAFFLGSFEFIAAQGALNARQYQKGRLTEGLSGNSVQPESLSSTAAYHPPTITADTTARAVTRTVTATGDAWDSRWPSASHKTSSPYQMAINSTPNSMTAAKPSTQAKSSYPTVESLSNESLVTLGSVGSLGGSTFAGPSTSVGLKPSEDDRLKTSTTSKYHSLPSGVLRDPSTSKTAAHTIPSSRTSAQSHDTALSTSTFSEMQGHAAPTPTLENEGLLGALRNSKAAGNTASSTSTSSENQAFLGGFLGGPGDSNVGSNRASTTPSIGNSNLLGDILGELAFRSTASLTTASISAGLNTTNTADGSTTLPNYSSPEHSLYFGNNPSSPLITTSNDPPSLTDNPSRLPGGLVSGSSGTPILTTQSPSLSDIQSISSDILSGVSSASVSSTRLSAISDPSGSGLLNDLSTVSIGFPSLTSTSTPSNPRLPSTTPVFTAVNGSSDTAAGVLPISISPSAPAAVSGFDSVTILTSITPISSSAVDAGKLSSASGQRTTQTSQSTATEQLSTIAKAEKTTLATITPKPTRSDSDTWAPSSIPVEPPTSGGRNDRGNKNGETNSSGDGGASSSSRPQASSVGIGVGAVAGAIAYGAGIFWIIRRYRRRRQSQRLNSNVDQISEPYHSNSTKRSRNISAPIMTKNSLGWS